LQLLAAAVQVLLQLALQRVAAAVVPAAGSESRCAQGSAGRRASQA
jgi:hypothetical protein